MKANLPYPAIATATATLVVGWAIGFLMSGSPDHADSLAGNAAAAAAQETGGPGLRLGLLEGSDAEMIAGAPANGSLAGLGSGSAARLETLVRGALRLSDSTDRVIRLREIARAIPMEHLPAAVEMARRLPMSERWPVLQALGARWAETDPAGAAEHAVKSGDNRYGWNQLLHGVIEKWSALDQDSAAAWVAKQPEGRRANLMQSLIQAVARQDPEAALRMLSAQPSSMQSSWLHDQVFEQWTKRDPAGAAKAADGLPAGAARDRALRSAAASWALQDPASAIKWAESFSDKNHQNKLLSAVAKSWAEHEPKAVIQWADTISEALIRQQILGGALSQLAQGDAAAARAHLGAMQPGQERDNLVVQVANRASQQDAKAALTFLEFLPEGSIRADTVSSLAYDLAQSDPKAAAELFATLPANQLTNRAAQFANALAAGDPEFAKEWVTQITEPQIKRQAMRAIARTMGRDNPRAAAEWLLNEQPGADLSFLVNSWVRTAPKDVLAWAKDLPEGDAKRSAQAAVVLSLTQADLQQARQLFAKELSPDAQTAAANQLANQWASRDLPAARAWAESLPQGSARNNAVGGIAKAWAAQDAAGAAQWLEKFAPGDERDVAVTQFAGTVAQRDPASAVAWAATIADPALRGAQLEQLASRWMQNDPASAREWISTAEQLSPSARRRVLDQRNENNYNFGNRYDDY